MLSCICYIIYYMLYIIFMSYKTCTYHKNGFILYRGNVVVFLTANHPVLSLAVKLLKLLLQAFFAMAAYLLRTKDNAQTKRKCLLVWPPWHNVNPVSNRKTKTDTKKTDKTKTVVVASAIFFAVVCWGSSIRASDTNRLDKIIKKTGSVLGLKLESLETVVERRMLNKLLSIMDNKQHPLHQTVDRQRSNFSHRLLQLRCRRDRYRKSFLPNAIALYNNS